MNERLGELIENLRDPYWWADRPVTQAAVAALAGGIVGLVFKALEIGLEELRDVR